MPFDGVDYADALLIPKVVTHPRAPMVGLCYGQGLRNSYFRERHHGQGGPTWAMPADFERAPVTDQGPQVYKTRANAVVVAEELRWVPDHYTHALAHCVFAPVTGEGGTAAWSMRAGSDPTTILDIGTAFDIPLTADSPSRIAASSGLSAGANPTDRGLYEAVVGVELANTPLGDLVHFQVLAGADEEDESGTRVIIGLELVSFSFWFESLG